jgi:hypothetical protein
MKRDMDLIRKIVLWAEEQPPGPLHDIKIEGHSTGEVAYHCYLLVDAGLEPIRKPILRRDGLSS